jgi:hypothetical protein
MTIQLELKPETEARLLLQATTQGVSIDRYLELLIESHLAIKAEPEWRVLLDQLGKSPSLIEAPSLSDEAVDRESIYREREDLQQ